MSGGSQVTAIALPARSETPEPQEPQVSSQHDGGQGDGHPFPNQDVGRNGEHSRSGQAPGIPGHAL
eukprot:16447125-Heterocapsa_arctica.AAC.1